MSWLKTPSWGLSTDDGRLPRPERAEVLREIYQNVAFWRDRRRWSSFLMFAGFVVVAPALTLTWLAAFRSWSSLAVAIVYQHAYLVLTNTLFWHRLACHRAFRFEHRWPLVALRWLAPVYVPVETYVLPHLVHHAHADRPGDPHSPRSGWLACMAMEWTTGVIDPDMSDGDVLSARRALEHTGIPLNDRDGLRREGTLQTRASLLGDLIVSTLLHTVALYSLGGWAWVLGAHAGLWWAHVLNLEFNFSSHGGWAAARGEAVVHGPADVHQGDGSQNQWAPGVFGGEWHNNHHLLPGSMRTGFLPGQLDVPWLLVRLGHRLGLVAEFEDHSERFRPPQLR